MPNIDISNFQGGISPKPNRGPEGSFKYGYGLDIRGDVDSLTCNQALKKISASTVTDLILCFVPASDGNLYAFGNAGAIYRINSSNVVTKVHTYAGADSVKQITGAAEYTCYDGANYVPYLFFATAAHLHRIKLSDAAGTWAGNVVEDWKAFSADDTGWHTIVEAMGDLLIADGQYLAMVDYESAYNSEALDIPKPHRIKTLLPLDQQVLLGSFIRDEVSEGNIWSWDNIAPSWYQRRRVTTDGVNAMLWLDFILIQAGEQGSLYSYDGDSVGRFRKLPGTGAFIHPSGMAVRDEIAYMGVNGDNKVGIYSFGADYRGDTRKLNHDYIISTGHTTNVRIGAVCVYNGQLYASWRDTTSGTVYGLDTVDTANKATGRYESMEVPGAGKATKTRLGHIRIACEPLPAGCTIAVQYRNNNGAWQDAALGDGTPTMATTGMTEGWFAVDHPEEYGRWCEVAVTLTPSGNTAPEIYSLDLSLEAVPNNE